MQPPYLFISHSSKDTEETQFIASRLSEVGYRCWVDVAAIPDGSSWLQEIERGVIGCMAMIVVMTENSRASEWVLAETLLAIEHQKPILVARFDDTPLPLQLITRQASDFRKRREAAMTRLLATLPTLVASKEGALSPVETQRRSPDPNRHNFFKYLEQLDGGAENSRIARDLYQWAKANADNVSFSGRSNPAFHAHVEVGLGGVVVFSMRAYPKQPAVEIPLQYLIEFPPFDTLEARMGILKRINSILPANAQLDDSRADRRPTIPLSYIASPDAFLVLRGIITDMFLELRQHN